LLLISTILSNKHKFSDFLKNYETFVYLPLREVCFHCHAFGNGNFKSCLVKERFNSSIIVRRRNSEAYQRLNYQWQLKGTHKLPLAYALVRSEWDVMAVVKCGKQFNIRVAPKGGGHSLEKYAFGDSNSIVVDLRRLKSLKVNKAKRRVTVGAGWLLAPLAYRIHNQANVFTPLGECSTVGIVGIASGGGWGYFVRKYGLTSDNILSVKIVTANGNLVTANKKRNAHLFWAIRGGVASNFGIVTQLVLRSYTPPSAVFYGTLVYDPVQFPEVFDAWQQYSPSAPPTVTAGMTLSGKTLQVDFVDVTGLGTDFELICKKFPKPLTKSTITSTYPEFMYFVASNLAGEIFTPTTKFESLADIVNIGRESAAPVFQKRKSFYVNRKLEPTQIRMLKSLLQEKPPIVQLNFESYGGQINDLLPNRVCPPRRHLVQREGDIQGSDSKCHCG